jgi:hypothetical protein
MKVSLQQCLARRDNNDSIASEVIDYALKHCNGMLEVAAGWPTKIREMRKMQDIDLRVLTGPAPSPK